MSLLIIGAVVVAVILLGALPWWIIRRRRVVRPAASRPGTYRASPPASLPSPGFGDQGDRMAVPRRDGEDLLEEESEELEQPSRESVRMQRRRIVRSEEAERLSAARRLEPTYDMMESEYSDAVAAPASGLSWRATTSAGGAYNRSTLGGPPPGTRVPFGVREEPLPHNGLFIRRNNAFGTKSTLGITDLIDQGVMIDQTQVRFDDFVVSKADQVPPPPPGAAIGVSHGACAVSADLKAHKETTHFVEIALRAGSATAAGPAPTHEVLPLNFVFVVDTSGSMGGEKLDTVKTAIRELFAQLRDIDILGIVTFDTQVRTVLKATRKSEISLDQLTSVLSGLSAYGGTDINLGTLYGIDEITRHSDGRSDIVNCIYLFSDGAPTSGETNWIKIRTNIAAKVRGDVTISCFGFGYDARMRELEALAGITGGFATFVTNADDVRLNLLDDLARREHLAAINIQLQIRIDPEIAVWHVYGHDLITDPATRARVERDAEASRQQARADYGVESLPHLITEDEGIRIFAPDLAYDETYWIVLELQAPPDTPHPDFGTAAVQYVDTLARSSRQHTLNLSEASTIPDEVVLAHAVGLWTSEITFYALDDLYQNDRETAKNRLSDHIQTLRGASAFAPAEQFSQDQVTFRKFMTLASNLGQVQYWSDHRDRDKWNFTVHTMSQFGQVRSGFVKHRYGTF